MGAPRGQRPWQWMFPNDPLTKDAYYKYLRAKAQAKFRMEPWDLTWDYWWALWTKSGQWLNRSNVKSGYCMSMTDRELGWVQNNVEIITRGEHFAHRASQAGARPSRSGITWKISDPKYLADKTKKKQ